MEYCENCGSKLEEDSKFCPKCGYNLTGKSKICPTCGNTLEEGANFCEECGNNTNLPKEINKEKFVERYRLPIVILAIITIALATLIVAPMLVEISAGSQAVTVDGYDFKIPDYFIHDEEASNKVIEENVTHDDWTNGDEHIEIAVLHFDSDTDIEKILVSLGGYKEERYGIPGHHYKFQNGEEGFSYVASADEMISIFVSDPKLFDKIERL